jgi:four helix bundle protein
VLNARNRIVPASWSSAAPDAGRRFMGVAVIRIAHTRRVSFQKKRYKSEFKYQKLNSKMTMQNAKSNGFKEKFKQRLYHFALRLIEFLDSLPKDNVLRRIGDQLLRSGTSILGNYAEGQSASSKKEFINFFTISLKSANESKLWGALLRDSKRTISEQVIWFLSELDEIANILVPSILTLKGKNNFAI